MAAKRSAKQGKEDPSSIGGNGDGRTRDGKFAKGNPGGPGNPNWKRLHQLRAAVNDAVSPEDLKAVMGSLKEIALGNDPDAAASDRIAAAKVLMERVCGKPQTPAAPVDLPEVRDASDLPAAYAAVLAATHSGECSIEQMQQSVALLQGYRAAYGEAAVMDAMKAMQAQIDALKAAKSSAGR